jgi:prophage maintenance system killer protein
MKDPITFDKIVETQKQILLFSALKEDNEMAGYLLDEGTLHHIIDKGSNFDCTIKKAAWYLFSLARYAPFIQGNKRTARRVATNILLMGKERYEIVSDDDKVVRYLKKIGNSECSFLDVEAWLRDNINQIR